MEPATWISLGALAVAVLGWLLNAWKAVRERRAEVRAETERVRNMSVQDLKADAERDNIAVHSAESALLIMEKMLNAANAAAEKADCKYAKCAEQLARYQGEGNS